jgi:predicted nucleic acid-binding Zn ribbon protein
VIRRIRWNGCYVGERDALRLAKQRCEDEYGEDGALQKDRNRQRAATQASFAAALLTIAIHKTTA